MSLRQGAWRACAFVSCFAISAPALAQYVSLAGGTPATQTFDSLVASGSATALPDGWYFSEGGTNADTAYAADDGSSNSGNTFSYGATGNSDRALGTLRSNKLGSTIGARLRNDSGAALGEIAVSYTGEQWRMGATGRTDSLQFQYSVDATSLGDAAATWINVAALDFASPVSTGTTGSLNGNLAANRLAVSGSITGLNLAPAASLWVRWVDLDISGPEDGLAIDDASFTVAGDPPPDLPPTVVATTPANNANDIQPSASLSVSFSEPVTLATSWFTLACGTSGSHGASVSGGPSTFLLTPAPAFAANESCTWTILANGVVDQDGTPDALGADHVVAFTIANPASTPPTVVSTEPADGASHVAIASDIRVTFSETVTTTNAFALACNAAPLALIESGSGATRTLTPLTLLPAGASCTFTINATGVVDADNLPLTSSYTAAFSVASAGGADYYSQVNTSSPDQLRCSLHLTIRGHTAYPYSGSGTNTWTILELAQESPTDPGKIVDIYRNHLYTAVSDRAGTGSGLTYNREHTWPNSLGFPTPTGDLGKPNAPYTDTHMLWLSDTQWNADRSNKPYANCATNCGERATDANNGVGGGSGPYPGNSNWTNGNSFEVWNHRKGEAARSIMYMAIRYEGGVDPVSGQTEPDLELTDDRSKIVGMNDYTRTAYMGLLTDLLAWSQADPPDAEERARDEVIYSFQGNRNPFVDHPEWATRALFESVNPPTCVLNTPTDTIFEDGFDASL